jgi:hypothetical protein
MPTLPAFIHPLAYLQKVRNKLSRFTNRLSSKKWPENSIVYYCPPNTSEPWDPTSLNRGIGGSQVSVIFLTKLWAKYGFKVYVYNNCASNEGKYDEVEYRDYKSFNPWDQFSTLIIWRMPWRMQFPNNAKRILLDIHETLIPEQRTFEKLSKYDVTFLKSTYHRSLFSELPDTQVVTIPNGVDEDYKDLFSKQKNPCRLIYASSYSRGLAEMLEFGWPLILQSFPDAQLHIYYGWSLPKNPTASQKSWKEKLLKLMDQPGVIEHGRVSQTELMQAKASSSIHYYGCTFPEIDCISVRESALVGCIPVTTDYAALSGKSYCLTVPGKVKSPATQEHLARKIVELLSHPEKIQELRYTFSEQARKETWNIISAKWLEIMFKIS